MTSATMIVDDYEGLQTYVCSTIRRPNDTDKAPTWIAIAEARLNRELGPVESDATLTGTTDSRRIDLSALSIVKPVALWLAAEGQDEQRVNFKHDGTFPYLTTSGKPGFAAMDESNAYIDFECPLDAAYPFRFRYQGRCALSDSVTTNWLLANHPDIYIAATIMWGYGYREQFANASAWKSILDEGIPEVRSIIRQSRRGVLSVDRALLSPGRMTLAQWTAG